MLLPLIFIAGCATKEQPKKEQGNAMTSSATVSGYLPSAALPNSLQLLPPPPEAGSPVFAGDEAIYRITRGFRNTPRWALAAQDAVLKFPDAAGTFSCAVGAPINEQVTPKLYMLLRRTLADAGAAPYTAKNFYRRQRPFAVLKETTCVPADESRLERDGSYPSGHASAGWAWALILAELAPEQSQAILQRGYAFGQSRVICGVHWQSDVNEARVVASSVVARLHADAAFKSDMDAARGEIAAARAKQLPPTRDCAAESAALATKLP